MSGPPNTVADTPRGFRLPVGTIAFLAALYARATIVWEQSHWGSQAVRDLVGNVAFMPFNLGVLVLFALASRKEVLDPACAGRSACSRSAAAWCSPATPSRRGTCSRCTRTRRSPGPTRSILSDSLLTLTALLLFPLARRTRLERWKFLLDAAMVLVGGGVAIWYFSVRPTAASQESSLVVTLLAFAYPLASMLVLLGVTTVLLRRPIDGNRLAFGLLVTGVVGRRGRGPHLQPGAARGRRPERELGRRRLPGLLRDADRERRALLAPAGGPPGHVRRAVHAVPADQPPALPRGRHHLRPAPVVALRPWTDPISGLAIGALLVTALVVLRQLLTVRENVRLLAEHAARQNEARFRSLVQHSSDVILVTRADGTIRFVSPSATRVFGYDPAAMLRQTVPDLLHPEDRERAATFFRNAAQAPGRHRPGRVALPPARRLVAPRRDPGDQPAARPDGEGHRAQHPRRERAAAAGGAAHPPGVPRSAHRARQPGAVPRPGEPRAGAGAAARARR